MLGRVIKQMKSDRSIEVATLARRIESDEELFDPNLVKAGDAGSSYQDEFQEAAAAKAFGEIADKLAALVSA